MAMGGRSITRFGNLLKLRGYHKLHEGDDLGLVIEIKEQISYVALNPMSETIRAEETTSHETTIHLADGTTVEIGMERFKAPEAFCQPKLWDLEQGGLSDLVFNAIQEVPIDCRVDLYQNIILCGGSSLLPGIQERLQHDLTNRHNRTLLKSQSLPSLALSKIEPYRERTRWSPFAVFEGAALFADLISDDVKFWVTKSQFANNGGMQVFLDKCLIFF